MKKYPRATIILRNIPKHQCVEIAKKADQYQCFALEVTLNSNDAIEIIEELSGLALQHTKIGAGTVINFDQLKLVAQAGAQFALSPVLASDEMIKYAHAEGMLIIPGAMTPTEIHEMASKGADLIKVFPANALGKNYCKSIQAPLGPLPLMAVGGVSAENIREFYEGGASYVGIGSSLFNQKESQLNDYQGLEKRLAIIAKVVKEYWDE